MSLGTVRLIVVCFLVSFGTSSLRAQSSSDTVEVALEEITIEASRSTETAKSAPFSVSVYEVSADKAHLRPSTTLNDALATLPGVWINDRQNFSLGERLAIRGFGAQAAFGVRGVQVLLDGIPLTMPDGQSTLGIIDPAFIGRAEVIRGPTSSFWGNSSGGVLSLSTGEYPEQFKTRLRTMAGSYGLRKVGAEVGGSVGSHRLRGFLSHHQQQGFRRHSKGERTRAAFLSDWDIGSFNRLQVVGALMNAPENQNPSALTKKDAQNDPRHARGYFANNQAGESNQQGQLGVRYTRQTPVGMLSAVSYGIMRKVDNPLPFAYIRVRRKAGGLRLQLRSETGKLRWGVGGDLGGQQDDRKNWKHLVPQPDRRVATHGDTLTLDQLETVMETAFYGRVTREVGRFEVGAGMRYDRLRFAMDDRFLQPVDPAGNQSGSRTFSAWNPTVGLSLKLPSATLFANLSTSFEAPTTTELVNRPDMTGGFNPELKPKRSQGVEAGVRGVLPNLQLTYDVAAFGYRVNGLLVGQEGPNERTYYQNKGTTRHLGVETRISWQMHPALHASLTASVNRFTFQSGPHAGNYVPGLPPRRTTGVLEWTPGSFYVSLQARSVATYHVDNANKAVNSAYAVTDLRLGHTEVTLGKNIRLKPFFAVQNVTNVRYNGSVVPNAFGGRYYEPAPGRTWQGGVNVELGR